MKKKILIVGSGGHAKSCIEIINQNKNFIIKGIVCENKNKYKPILNIPCVGEDKDLERLRNVFKYCFIGIGQIKKNNNSCCNYYPHTVFLLICEIYIFK